MNKVKSYEPDGSTKKANGKGCANSGAGFRAKTWHTGIDFVLLYTVTYIVHSYINIQHEIHFFVQIFAFYEGKKINKNLINRINIHPSESENIAWRNMNII